MARIVIDASVVGANWFASVVEELQREKNVVFVLARDKKTANEHARTKKLQTLYAIMSKQPGRVRAISESDCERHTNYLEGLPAWKSESACDDAPVFAACYEGGARFVFTGDGRMAKCRRCINRTVDSRYCEFRLVRNHTNYKANRAAILA